MLSRSAGTRELVCGHGCGHGLPHLLYGGIMHASDVWGRERVRVGVRIRRCGQVCAFCSWSVLVCSLPYVTPSVRAARVGERICLCGHGLRFALRGLVLYSLPCDTTQLGLVFGALHTGAWPLSVVRQLAP